MSGNGQKVNITINGRALAVPKGTNVLQVCLDHDIPLEHFCYHPYLPVDGNCRTCMIEVETPRGRQLTIACNTQVAEGMVVFTNSEKAEKAQKSALEFLLLDHPVDCPICDKAGECKLQDHYMAFGRYDHRRSVPRYFKGGKALDVGAHIVLDRERCILCTRCIRFCDEVTGTGEIGIVHRGHESLLSVFPEHPLDNPYSGNTTDVCPVGALTLKEFRFKQRVWFLKKTESICPGCARGCNITIDHNRGKVWRFMPRENPSLNRAWMCDEGRFSFPSIHAGRLNGVLLRKDAGTWVEGYEQVAEWVKEAGESGVWGAASPFASVEDLYAFKKFFEACSSIEHLFGVLPSRKGEGDELLRLPERWPNEQGLRWLGFSLDSDTLLSAGKKGKVKLLFLLEGDLLAEGETLAALKDHVEYIVVFSSHFSATVRSAALAFATLLWAEKNGTFVNATSRLQRFRRAIESTLDAKWVGEILQGIAGALGCRMPAFSDAEAAFDALANEKGLKEKWATLSSSGKVLESLPPIAPEPFLNRKVDFNVLSRAE